AEDGIRDFHVTGVQTCALPISPTTKFQRSSNSQVSKKDDGRESRMITRSPPLPAACCLLPAELPHCRFHCEIPANPPSHTCSRCSGSTGSIPGAAVRPSSAAALPVGVRCWPAPCDGARENR